MSILNVDEPAEATALDRQNWACDTGRLVQAPAQSSFFLASEWISMFMMQFIPVYPEGHCRAWLLMNAFRIVKAIFHFWNPSPGWLHSKFWHALLQICSLWEQLKRLLRETHVKLSPQNNDCFHCFLGQLGRNSHRFGEPVFSGSWDKVQTSMFPQTNQHLEAVLHFFFLMEKFYGKLLHAWWS